MVHVSTKSKYFLGGGTSGRAIELFVHFFFTTLFHDFSEINWFVATNFRIHDVGYLENEIQETHEKLVHNEKYLRQPGFCVTRKNFSYTQKLVYRYDLLVMSLFAFVF